MKRTLIVTSVASMIKQFNIPNIKLLQQLEYEVTVAANFTNPGNIREEDSKKLYRQLKDMGIVVINVNFHRNPFSKDNLRAYRQIKLIIDENKYEMIHCQSPIGGALTRLAAQKARENRAKIIYTAHGFHFYKGASIVNWLTYFPIEKYLSNFTDVLITINNEDFQIAKKSLNAKRTVYVPGVGLDIEKYTNKNSNNIKRSQLGFTDKNFLILSVGELNKNKNHEIVIRSIAKLNNEEVHYIVCGKGLLHNQLRELTKELGVSNQVHFLGFRDDVSDIYSISNLFILPSFREGLSVALMEAMANGMPVICSNIRGNIDLIDDSYGGYLFNPSSDEELFQKIKLLTCDDDLRKQFGKYNISKIEKFGINPVTKIMKKIYLHY